MPNNIQDNKVGANVNGGQALTERLKQIEQMRKKEEEIKAKYEIELAKVNDDKNYLVSIDRHLKVITNLEEFKRHYRNFSYDSKNKIEEFLDEHKVIDEQDFKITNIYKRFIQASELVDLEILKMKSDLLLLNIFLNNSNLIPNFINEYDSRIGILLDDVLHLREARKNQEIAYKNYQACFAQVDNMLQKLKQIEYNLRETSSGTNIELLLDIHSKAKESFDVMKAKQNETADNNSSIKLYQIEQPDEIKKLESNVKIQARNFKNFINTVQMKMEENNKAVARDVKPSSVVTPRQQFSQFQPAPQTIIANSSINLASTPPLPKK